ncbi:signal transduction histidine kinase [Lutibacter sp. Hel_I_33_5]|uniref:hybrid sensor histidine kinase/response regulator transcription factor n=1 Tax=Lutibacter sp. Hel_I_33_5 TaxID=1566289 RepID=UPI0011A29E36|nr:two-component regulator propeller domain-containing protein [Lutibacter sp. Hel_I_33_5]TVZ55644.1 signal transduction histidine kinase [Lutibacter sp. Hel_I_33_5]
MKNIRYTTFFICYFLFLSVFGQEESTFKSIKFKHFSLKDGLSQSSVLSITQDSDGFLWFGTRDGLNKYDAYSFKTFRHHQEDSTSISNNYIKTLFEDPNGNLWIGTQNGLNKYNKENDSFKKIHLNNSNSINAEIWNIISFDKENILVGTNKGINKININTEKADDSFPKISTPIRALFIDSNRNLWVKSVNNVEVYNLNDKEQEKRSYKLDKTEELTSNRVSSIYEDRQNNIWIGYKNGLAIYNKEKDSFDLFKLNNKPVISEHVRDIHEDYLGNLWIGTYDGVYIFNKTKTQVKYIQHQENDPNSLSQNSVYKIFEDSKGDIWVGTYAGGINYYDRSFDSFKLFSSGTTNSLNYKVVSSIVEDNQHNLWIGTEGGGINFYNKKTGDFKHYTKNNSQRSLSTNNVKAILKDNDDNLWIGTHDGGLNFLNTKKEPFSFEKFRNNPNDTLSLSNDRVVVLHEDSNKNIWIGTSGGGINTLNKKRKNIKRLPALSTTVGDYIYTITNSTDKNYIYIGGDKGLCKTDINTLKVEKIDFQQNKKNNNTLSVFEDENKNLWIGTEGDGLYYYDSKTKESTKYGTTNGLLSEIVYGILPDDDGSIWLSTNKGLSKFDIKNFQIKNFDVSDGIQGNEFNYGAYLKGYNGDLYFGGANGLTAFNPNKITENSFVPPVLITDVLINNQPYKKKYKEKITLTHDQNVFGFNFIALSYSKANKNQFAYKLEGFDKDWNYVGTRKSTVYTNIDAGTYTFRVKASNSDRLWNEKGAELKVRILPAPWKTWWAYLIYIIGAACLLYLFRKYYLIRIKEKNELKKEREEKEQIEEVNALKLQLFTNISHDFRTPLTLIIGPLEKMINEQKGDSFIKEQHSVMHRNAMVLLQLINQLLDFRKNESGQLKLKASKNNIVSFINEIKISFNELAKAKNINFNLDTSDENIKVWFDKIKLKKIMYNLLSNAFKNTNDGGEISIKISTKEKKDTKYIQLDIEDTGKGISKENVKYIFDRFYQLGQKSNTQLGTGIGLSLTKSLVNLHNGKITVKSTKGKGSVFTVTLPLGKSHLKKNQLVNDKNLIENSTSQFLNPIHQATPQTINNDISKNQVDNTLSTLLIVEDNPEVRSLLKSIFNNNYNIVEAENGKIALELAIEKSIDLILSDVMMPEMDGIELCQNIKSNIKTSHIPVVLLTAKTSKKSQDSGFQTGADSYILKPFDPKTLSLRIDNLINSRKNLISKFRKELITKPKEIVATSADEKFLAKALEIVENNLSNPDFSVIDLTEKLNMSRSVLYRKIKALTGQSIAEFIRTIKLKRAGQLITSKTDMNISEIAYELGFNDLKHFRKLFKKQYNELPSQYRVNHTK